MGNEKKVSLTFPIYTEAEWQGIFGTKIIPKGQRFLVCSGNNIYEKIGDGANKFADLPIVTPPLTNLMAEIQSLKERVAELENKHKEEKEESTT